jgi:hypothetical protein
VSCAVFGKDFYLGAPSFFDYVFTHESFASHHEDQYLQKMTQKENETSIQPNFFNKDPTIQGQLASPSQNASNGQPPLRE